MRTRFTDSDWLILSQEEIAARQFPFSSTELIVNRDTGEVRQGPGENFAACTLVGSLGSAVRAEDGTALQMRVFVRETDDNGDVTLDLPELLGASVTAPRLIGAVSTTPSVPLLASLLDPTPDAFVVRFQDADGGSVAKVQVTITIAYS